MVSRYAWLIKSKFGQVLATAYSIPERNRLEMQYLKEGYSNLELVLIDNPRELDRQVKASKVQPFNGINISR